MLFAAVGVIADVVADVVVAAVEEEVGVVVIIAV